MNMLEVAYEFTGITELIVGSQQTEPGDGWPYGDVVNLLKVGNDEATVGNGIVNAYIAFYKKAGQSNVTQSAIEIGKLANVGKAVDGLANALLTANKGKVLEARVITQGYEEPTYVDLINLTQNIAAKITDAKVKTACKLVEVAVTQSLVANGSYGGAVNRSSGLSIWMPLLKSDYVTRRSEYIALRYNQVYPRWAQLLDILLAV
jgi:hypothetical protein